MDKTVLVTGASRGIGKAIINCFARQEGYYCIGTATTKENAETISKAFLNPEKGCGLVLNLQEADSVSRFTNTLQEKNLQPDILINNAGITRDNLLIRMNENQWQDVINVNLNSVFTLTKLCVKSMIKKRWGRIISISSVVALSGNPGQTNYSAAKSGLLGFTKSLALEIASRNITVNAVAPGFIESDMTARLTQSQHEKITQIVAMQRMGKAEEVAHAVYFLAGENAGYITGETININGGLYCH